MKFWKLCKDGGAESTVWAYVLFEIKSVASVMVLRFEDGTRDAYHSHAFNAVSWVLRGYLTEMCLVGPAAGPSTEVSYHRPSLRPIVTRRDTFHKVRSSGRTWVLTFRGPWVDTWREWTARTGNVELTHGRGVVGKGTN